MNCQIIFFPFVLVFSTSYLLFIHHLSFVPSKIQIGRCCQAPTHYTIHTKEPMNRTKHLRRHLPFALWSYLGLNKNKLRMLLSMMICWLLSSFTWLIYFTITANSFVSITKRVKYLMWPNSIYLQGKSIEQSKVLSIISITFLSLI